MIIFVLAQAMCSVGVVSEQVIDDMIFIEEDIARITDDIATFDDTMILLPPPGKEKSTCPFVFKDMVIFALIVEQAAIYGSTFRTDFKSVTIMPIVSIQYRTEYGSVLSFCMYSYSTRGELKC